MLMASFALISGGLDGMVKLWDPTSRALILQLYRHNQSVCSFSVQSNVFYSCAVDNIIKVWDWKDGTLQPAGLRKGITETKYVEGLLAFWDGIIAAKPGAVVDGCSGGGRNIDLETISRGIWKWCGACLSVVLPLSLCLRQSASPCGSARAGAPISRTRSATSAPASRPAPTAPRWPTSTSR